MGTSIWLVWPIRDRHNSAGSARPAAPSADPHPAGPARGAAHWRGDTAPVTWGRAPVLTGPPFDGCVSDRMDAKTADGFPSRRSTRFGPDVSRAATPAVEAAVAVVDPFALPPRRPDGLRR